MLTDQLISMKWAMNAAPSIKQSDTKLRII